MSAPRDNSPGVDRAGASRPHTDAVALSESVPPVLEVNVTEATVRHASLRAFMQNRLAVASCAFLVLEIAFCFVGPLLYHTDQVHSNLRLVTLPPSHEHPLGTDQNGMDELGRLMLGGQVSLEVGALAALLATVVGTAWGAVAGYVGGVADVLLMRVVDAALSIPTIFLLVCLAAIITPTKISLVLLLAFISWLETARLVRSESLSLRERDFVGASKIMGGGPFFIIRRHIAPNAVGTVIVNATFQVADAILWLAALGYLGLSLPAPQTDLGAMLSQGLQYVYAGSWWLIWPAGLTIIGIVAAANFVGDGLRDAFDVRIQKQRGR